MMRIFTLFGALLFSAPSFFAITITSNAGAGNWSAAGTWFGGAVPTAADDVIIANGATVTIDAAANALTLTVGQGTSGAIVFASAGAQTLTVADDVTVMSGGSIASAATGTVTTHSLSIGGDLFNSGTVDLSTNTNTAGATLLFTGATDAELSGSGSVDLRGLTINKGTTWVPVLWVKPTALTVRGVSTNVLTFLTITNGTIRFGGSYTLSSGAFTLGATGSYDLTPATGGFWCDNPNITLNGLAGTATCNGKLRVDQGLLKFGTGAGNRLAYLTTTDIEINGGTVEASGRFSGSATPCLSFKMTGGTLKTATVSNTSTTNSGFDLTVTTFTMSGGTIEMVVPGSGGSGPRDFRCLPTNDVITGGTLIGNQAAGTYNIQGVTPNIVLSGTQTFQQQGVTYPVLNLTVPVGTTYALNNFAAWTEGNTTINGSLTGPLATLPTSRFYFAGTVAQTLSGTGTLGSAAGPIAGMGIDNAAGATISTTNQMFVNRANLFEGTITGSAKLTIGNNVPTGSTVQISAAANTTPGGSFDASPVWALSSTGLTVLYLQETVGRTMGFEIPPSRTLNTFSLDNTNGLTFAGGDLTASTIILTNGKAALGASNMTLAPSGTLTGGSAASYFVTNGAGSLKRTVDGTARLFPIGSSTTSYDPATLTNTGTSNVFGVLVDQSVTSPRDPSGVVDREWNITENGPGGSAIVSMSLTYDAAATTGGSYNPGGSLVIGHRVGANWLETAASIAGTTVTAGGFTSFSPFAVGNAGFLLPLDLLSFTAVEKGNSNRLEWRTANEIDVREFVIERSADGVAFQSIGQKTALGSQSPNGGAAYFFDDQKPLAKAFYRLRIVENSGISKHSPVRSVDRKAQKATVKAFPTAFDRLINLQIDASAASEASWQLFARDGRQVQSGRLELSKGANLIGLELAALPADQYVLEVMGGDGEALLRQFVFKN